MKIKNILTGWANLTLQRFNLLPEGLKERAEDALMQCNSCTMRSGNTCDSSKQERHIETNEVVSGCGCNLSAKTLDPNSECPIGKWKKYKK
jgi:hypothetical protein